MPHLTLEHSANLRADGDLSGLCRKLAQVLIEARADGKAVFPIGGVRVRALPSTDWCIADGSIADAGFVHAVLKMGAGRDEATRTGVGDALFQSLKTHFAARFASHGLALSLEISEFSEAGTWKHNNLHARFKPL